MLKVGDTVEMFDGSYAFGVKNGGYDTLWRCSERGPFTVIVVGLKTTINAKQRMCDRSPATANILIGDNDGGFWFVPSRFARKLNKHTITFDNGDAIEISDESYRALRNQLS